jgi:prevent-host-death family protein
MGRIVNIHEAKTHLSRLVEAVNAGETIVLAKGGKPCAKLVPFEAPAKRTLGFVTGRLTETFFEPLPDHELASWE